MKEEKNVGQKLMEWELDHKINRESYERGKKRAKEILAERENNENTK